MTGLCGWHITSQPASDGVLAAMQRQLPPRFSVSEEINTESASIACRATDHGNLCRADQLLVVLDGVLTNAPHSASVDGPQAADWVAKLYGEHGIDCVKHLKGDFAVAIVDPAQQRTLLAVDRRGVRPMAYATPNDNGNVIFGSTVTAVAAHPLVPKQVDHQSIFNYVYFHVIPSPRTIFESISKLPAAHRLVSDSNGVRVERYWKPDYTRQSAQNLRGKMLPELRESVLRASSHTTAGAFLSGGLDSSTVSGLLQQTQDAKTPVFSIGFDQEGYDELEYARLAASHFGLNLTEYYITAEDIINGVGEVANAYDEPFGNSSAVPTLVCARLAKQHGIDTLLAGDGGDELFGGNERYATQKLFSYYNKIPSWFDRSVLSPFFSRASVKKRTSGFQHKVRRYIEQAHMPMPGRTQNYNLLHLLGASSIFSDEFLKDINVDEPGELLHQEYWQDGTPDQLERLLRMDYKFTLADNDLRKVNRMCELADVEVRYPMLDDDIVSFSNRIPSNVKLKRQDLRSYFKNETRDFLPTEIINKTKHGFGLPFGEWLKQDPQLSELINSSIANMRTRGIFQNEFIDDIANKHQNEHAAYYGGMVWVLAMLDQWMEAHQVNP